jgi:hypothetical protein
MGSVCADFRALCWVAAANASLPMVPQMRGTIGKLRLPLPPDCQIIFTDTMGIGSVGDIVCPDGAAGVGYVWTALISDRRGPVFG